MRRALTLLAFGVTLAAAGVLLAHGGHAHHVMGTVNAVDAKRLEVKDTADKIVPVQLTGDTRYLRGEELVTVADVRVGERVMVETAEQDGALIARVVRLETAGAE